MAIKCRMCIHKNISGYAGCCDYLKDTGHCKIVTAVREDGTEYKTVSPVENCAFFHPVRRRKPVEAERVSSTIAKIDYELVHRLYMQAFTDQEIAKKVGCDKSTIWAWRKRNKLAPARYRKQY